MSIAIERLAEPTDRDAQDIAELLPQMTSNKVKPLSKERLEEVLRAGTIVLVARDGERVVGAMALAVTRQLVGEKYWLEDLVVDRAYRGQGIASRLMDTVLGLIPDDAYSINLTSKASRPEARAWYQRLGFEQKSNVYRSKRAQQ